MHLSLRGADDLPVTGLPQEFVTLLEQSFIAHIGLCLPLLTSPKKMTQMYNPSSLASSVVGVINDPMKVHYFYTLLQVGDSGDHHYEWRRTMPGRDVDHWLPFNPMLMAQTVAAASVYGALEALRNPPLRRMIEGAAREQRGLKVGGMDYMARVDAMADHPLLASTMGDIPQLAATALHEAIRKDVTLTRICMDGQQLVQNQFGQFMAEATEVTPNPPL
jgi:hypothetical protein